MANYMYVKRVEEGGGGGPPISPFQVPTQIAVNV